MAVNIVSRTIGAAFLASGFIFRFMGIIPMALLLILTLIIFLVLHGYLVDAIYYTNSKNYKELVKNITN